MCVHVLLLVPSALMSTCTYPYRPSTGCIVPLSHTTLDTLLPAYTQLRTAELVLSILACVAVCSVMVRVVMMRARQQEKQVTQAETEQICSWHACVKLVLTIVSCVRSRDGMFFLVCSFRTRSSLSRSLSSPSHP